MNTKGLTERRFREFRRLYQVYPQLQSPVAQYIVSHSEIRHTPTAELQNVDIQTENWQMPASKLFNKLPYSSLYYERSGLSQNKEALSALVQQQAAQLQPKDVINTPVTLEFLGLNERALVTEDDLEQSILDNLQNFLLEMGHGFCFEARQKRILIDGDGARILF